MIQSLGRPWREWLLDNCTHMEGLEIEQLHREWFLHGLSFDVSYLVDMELEFIFQTDTKFYTHTLYILSYQLIVYVLKTDTTMEKPRASGDYGHSTFVIIL